MAKYSTQKVLKKLLMKMKIWPLLVRTGLNTPSARMLWLLQHPRIILPELELLADYLVFRMRYGSFLHKGQELADPNRKLLVLSFSDYVAQVKAEAFLAKALQIHGITPVIVTHSACQRALKYYRLFGIDQFVFFNKLLESSEFSKQAAQEAEAFFTRPFKVQDIKNYQYHGTRLGAHLLRTVTRFSYQGSLDLSNPEIIGQLKPMMLEVMHNVETAEVLLDSMQPEIIFTHHPLNIGEGDIYEVGLQRGINTIQWDGAQEKDHWIFKRYTKEARDRSFFSLSDDTWEQVQQMTWDEEHEATLMKYLEGRYNVNLNLDGRQLQEGKKLKTKEEVQQQLGLDPRKKTAVVFSHIVWDYSFLQGVDLFGTYEDWLVETTKAACENPAVNWIIKMHPGNIRKLKGNRIEEEPSEVVAIRNAIGVLPEHVKLLYSDTDINTWSLFELTDYCLTVRGTIGIEMPCFGIPVLTAGTGRYSGYGFTIDSDSREEYLERLHNIQNIPRMSPQQIEMAKKHAYCLFLQRSVRFNMAHKLVRQNRMKYTGHPLVSNYTFQIASLNDLISNPELDAFAQWAISSKELDFGKDYSALLEEPL